LPRKFQLGLLIAALLTASMWFYAKYILIGYQKAEAAALGKPRGNLSDLYPRWLGARELLLHHRDPYSAEVTREIQVGYYGRTLDPTRPNDPTDQQGFAYPTYVVFLLAPTIFAPFSVVQAVFYWLLPPLVGFTVLLWLRMSRWRPPWEVAVLLMILALGSFPAVQGIALQQLSLIVGGLIAGSAVLLVRGRLAAAGVLLALASIKPQLVWLVAAWLLVWTLSQWRQRQRFFWGFAGTCALLFLAADLVQPGWIWRFREAIANYRRYTGAVSVLETLLAQLLPGLWWGRALNALIALAVLWLGWRMRREPEDSPAFAFLFALVMAATVVVVPMVAPYNQLLLLPGVIFLAQNCGELWRRNRVTKTACTLGLAAVFWPWMATLGLAAATLFRPLAAVQAAWALPLFTSLGIPIVVLGLLALQLSVVSQQSSAPAASRPQRSSST
jgi:Glycosyltransferase family 87